MKVEYRCPYCGSIKVATEDHQMIMINTDDFYCHSVKYLDLDSPATCLSCNWRGQKNQFIKIGDEE
jgi:rubredoxin